MEFSFSNLSLSGVTAAAGVSVLAPGKYVVKVSDVEMADTKNKSGKIMKVKLRCDAGVITDNINVFNASAKAQEIGLEQLKGLLVAGGHPDPDNIGQHGLASIKGLTVGIIVGQDGTYNGEPSFKVKGYLKPDQIGAGAGAANKPAAPDLRIGDDDLPF